MEIKEKLENYHSQSNYEPLKVVFYLTQPIYTTSAWINLDSIIYMLCFREALGEDFYNLPTTKIIRYDDLETPILKTDDIFHTSVGKFEDKTLLKIDKIYKRFTDKETRVLTSKKNKGKIKVNQGYYKDFLINLPAVYTKSITFYTNADKLELERLLSHLKNIGKKTSIGGGKIKKIEIKETDADYSFYKDGEVMRCIPTKYAKKIPLKPGTSFSIQSYKPPYWDNTYKTMCLTPPNQLKEVLRNA